MSSNNGGKGYTVTSSGTNSRVIGRGPIYEAAVRILLSNASGQPLLHQRLFHQQLAARQHQQLSLFKLGWYECLYRAIWVFERALTFILSPGSYYYSNPNGSTYHNDGKGGSTYTPGKSK